MATITQPHKTQDKADPVDAVYGELIELLLEGVSPEKIIAFRPSKTAHVRLYDLMERERNGGLSPSEQKELDRFMELEHVLRMAKIRARFLLRKSDPAPATGQLPAK